MVMVPGLEVQPLFLVDPINNFAIGLADIETSSCQPKRPLNVSAEIRPMMVNRISSSNVHGLKLI